eukprot:GHVQ01034696.1.p1 GENE.GHVQ01034696.1~~GHVQ01034696.1.p1  ORF type:complete len:104 (+),score=22.01 GHVQ01034696.1:566-877(+)
MYREEMVINCTQQEQRGGGRETSKEQTINSYRISIIEPYKQQITSHCSSSSSSSSRSIYAYIFIYYHQAVSILPPVHTISIICTSSSYTSSHLYIYIYMFITC